MLTLWCWFNTVNVYRGMTEFLFALPDVFISSDCVPAQYRAIKVRTDNQSRSKNNVYIQTEGHSRVKHSVDHAYFPRYGISLLSLSIRTIERKSQLATKS